MPRLLLFVLGLLLALGGDGPPTDVLLRFDGDVLVAAGETAPATAVLGGDAVVNGVVQGGLFVADGRATVRGTVEGPVVVVGGRLDLDGGAHVADDIVLVRSTMSRAAGATVGGEVVSESGVSMGPAAGWFFWMSATFAALVAGLAFVALFGGRPGAVAAAVGQPGPAAVVSLTLVAGLPVAAVLCLMTGVGVVLGFGILFVLIPLLWGIGYVVSGVALGHAVLGRLRGPGVNGYAAAAVGLALLQAALAVPFVGGLALLAGPYGAGAALYDVWSRRLGGREPEPPPAPPPSASTWTGVPSRPSLTVPA